MKISDIKEGFGGITKDIVMSKHPTINIVNDRSEAIAEAGV